MTSTHKKRFMEVQKGSSQQELGLCCALFLRRNRIASQASLPPSLPKGGREGGIGIKGKFYLILID